MSPDRPAATLAASACAGAFGIVLLFWILLSSAGCVAPWWSADPPSIVLITIDTIRADRLGAYGYVRPTSPNLDRLAAEAVRFEKAIAPMATTLPAHVSLMTSLNPMAHGVKGNFKEFDVGLDEVAGVRSFAQILQELGYSTAAFVSAAPLKRATGIDAGFSRFDEPAGKARPARATTLRVLRFLEADPPRPLFLWVHYFDPHAPYRPPPGHRGRFETDDALLGYLRTRAIPDPENPRIQRFNNLYDDEIAYMDEWIGRLLERLREKELYDSSAVVVAGDHGEGLGQHGWIIHGRIWNEQLFVPLIVKFPRRHGHGGEVRSNFVSLIDVVPTLVDGLELPVAGSTRERFEGIDAMTGPEGRYVFSERVNVAEKRVWGAERKFAWTGPDWKYLLAVGGDGDRRDDGEDGQLYDLRFDPHETRDVAAEYPDVARELRARLLEVIASYPRRSPGLRVDDDLPPELLRQLRALGYVR